MTWLTRSPLQSPPASGPPVLSAPPTLALLQPFTSSADLGVLRSQLMDHFLGKPLPVLSQATPRRFSSHHAV